MSKWITESGAGFGVTIETEELLYSAQSPFQKIEIYRTSNLGRMLVLDGVIQLTEFDEFAYQEMLAHVPAFAHPEPRSALIIGGGDGGVARELAKHPSIETIDLCEIDEMVVAAARKYLPFIACGFDDPRVRVHIGDGAEFVAARKSAYDLVIVDSSDPIGPNESLFNDDFYRHVKRALKPGGIAAAQAESYYLYPQVATRLTGIFQRVFGNTAYSGMLVPSYPGGAIGACVAAADGRDVRRPARRPAPGTALKYYTPAVHEASFVLPVFAEKLFEEAKK